MKQDWIERREQVMDRVERALEAAFPARMGNDYVREMRWAVDELGMIVQKMQAEGVDRVERSRTCISLGTLYADLAPALGKEMLLKARESYRTAEALLTNQSDELVRAKLDFNYANTLRQIDPNDLTLLQEAKRRFCNARACFAVKAPQYLAQVDAGLQSVGNLLKIAPLSNAVKQNTEDMATLQKELAAGGSVSEIGEKTQKVMRRGGGVAGMVGQLQAIVDSFPDEQPQSEKFADIRQQMHSLANQALGNNEMAPEVKQVFSLLNTRLKNDADNLLLSEDHASALGGVLEEFGRILSGDENDINALRAKMARIKEFLAAQFEMAHYLSHGIKRPSAHSRAGALIELNWLLRRYLLEEMSRPEKGAEESKEALDLSMRATKIDRRIYEAGAEDNRAMVVEKEELRPLALAIRDFSARMQTMVARPVWQVANVPAETNAVFFSGPAKERSSIEAACQHLGLEILPEPRGESHAGARWKQIQKAITSVFDLRTAVGPDMAAVTYELGIALTLGKPVVVFGSEGRALPFDVEIEPVVLTGGPEDRIKMESSIDHSVFWTYPRPRSDASLKTLDYVLSKYLRPQQNICANQTLKMLSELRSTPDPLAMSRTLVTLFDYLNDGETMLLHPRWSPAYPEPGNRRLFHIMPFRPNWADKVASATREACKAASVTYIRGDEVADPNVIRSIWEEIARATHLLVDLTGFNANVALELGIAHTLGKRVLMVGQGDPKGLVFQSISRYRVQSYDCTTIEETLGSEVREFLLSN